MPIECHFSAWAEDRPGPLWQAAWERFWPGYRAWFLRSTAVGRPSFLDCRRALRKHMPELVPVWQRLCELAGGGDTEARFLSLWCPPPFIAGCAQAVWIDGRGTEAPALLRNYDFAPVLLEGSWLATRWAGQRVLALGDCLWGALDGINEAGLAASLSFGGRTVCGSGFGVPLILRYVLEVAQSTAEAITRLQSLPSSMSYSLTLLDRRADAATVFIAPDRAAEVTRRSATTNFQHQVEWPEHARATRSVERLDCLEKAMAQAASADEVVAAMLRPPLYQTSYQRGYGTLYTAAYRPHGGSAELLWPGQRWVQSVDDFSAGERRIVYTDGGTAGKR